MILIQVTNDFDDDRYRENLLALASDVLFREYDGLENSVQAYFPQTDCADVAMRLQDFSLKFKSQGNFLFTINQGLYLYNQAFNESCMSNIVLMSNAKQDMIIFGSPFFQN